MAAVGLCTVCPGATLSPATLLAAVREAIGRGTPPRAAINLDGAARTAAVVSALLAGAPVSEIAAGHDFGR